jgi:hypothetical protein
MNNSASDAQERQKAAFEDRAARFAAPVSVLSNSVMIGFGELELS